MRAKITNFRGVKRAELELARVTLITGPNASGKTSIALALSAAASGQPIPVPNMRKADAGLLVHAGTGKGSVELETDRGRVAVGYPRATVESEGEPPSSTPLGLGLEDLTAFDAKRAAATLLKYLQAMPTLADLTAALEPAKLTEKQLAALWQNTQDLGWDGAHEAARQKGATLKGQWQQVTGEQYGTAKADRWLPSGWETGLEGASEESLIAALTQANEFRDAAVAASAVTADRRDRLAAEALEQQDRELAAGQKRAELEAADKLEAEERKILSALPMPQSEQRSAPCPHCSQPIVVNGGTLEKPRPFDATIERDRQAARSAQQAKLQKVIAAREAARGALSSAEAQVRRAQAAAAELAKLPEHDPEAAAQLEQAREQVKREETKLKAFRSKRQADQIHGAILQNITIVSVLAADGLRLRKLRTAVRAFNESLAELSRLAGWGVVELADDLSVVYSGCPLIMLSASECYRVRVTVQLALARIDSSALVVIDAADILDTPGRNGLMRVARAQAVPVVICMTMKREHAPASSERCRVYWLESGTARENVVTERS